MARVLKLGIFLLFFLFSVTGQTESNPCLFQCQNLGSFLIGSKGLKRLFDEKVNSPEFKAQLRASMIDTIKKFPPQILYETPDECKTEKVGNVIDGLILREVNGLQEKCLLYPKLKKDGSFGYSTQLQKFKMQADQFALEDIDFEFVEPKFDGKNYTGAIKINSIKLASRIALESKGPDKGALLENPDLLFTSKASGDQSAAAIDVVVTMDQNGRFDLATGALKNLKVTGESMKLESIIRGPDGRVLSNGYGSDGRYHRDQDAQGQHIRSVTQDYLCDYFKKLYSELDADALERFFQRQQDEMERARFEAARYDGSQMDARKMSEAAVVIVGKKKNGQEITCRNKPLLFHEMPAFKTVAEQAKYSAKGYSGKHAALIFESVVDTVNEGTFTNDRVMKGYIIPQIEEQVILKAKEELARALKEMAEEMSVLMDLKMQIPVIDVGRDIRKAAIEDRIKVLEAVLLHKKARGPVRDQRRRELEQLRKDLAEIDKQISQDREIGLYTRYSVDKVGDLNRVRLLNANVDCPGLKPMASGILTEREMKDHEFVFEMPVSTMQAYIDEMYKTSPYICTDSTRKDCKGGSKLMMTAPPKIECRDEGKCRVQFGKVKTKTGGFISVLSKFDFDMELELGKCGGNNLCLNMNQPNVKNEGFFVWLKGAFSSSVAEDAQAVMNDIRKDGGIPISSAIPKEIRESFTFGDVIYRQNTVGIPMNLNERNNRVLLK